MIKIINDSDFLRVGMNNYDNPSCLDTKEFEKDLKRISSSKRILVRYLDGENINFRLLLNSFIVIYNIFGSSASDLLIYKYENDLNAMGGLIPILSFLGRLDAKFDHFIPKITINSRVLNDLENL